MHTRGKSRYILAGLVLFAQSIAVHRAVASEAGVQAKMVAPFIDAQTICVAHLDLERADVKTVLKLAGAREPNIRLDRLGLFGGMESLRRALLENGFRQCYIVTSLADVPESLPLVVVPKTKQSNVNGILDFVRQWLASKKDSLPRVRHQEFGGALIFGSTAALKRVSRCESDRRPDLLLAFRAVDDMAVQVVLLPTDDDRRVVQELLPELPAEVGGGSSTVLTQGVRWAAFGVSMRPPGSRLVVQSFSQDAAAALANKLPRAVNQLARSSGWAKATQQVAVTASERLVPKVEKDRIVMDLQQANGGISTLQGVLAPIAERLEAYDLCARSRRNLRRIAYAIHMWHDLHKAFPVPASHDQSGEPLLSWRVHLLPLLGHESLYRQFHLNEPWDSSHNRLLIKLIPDVFQSLTCKRTDVGYTTYALPVHAETIWPGGQATTFRDIRDGSSYTIMVVEVDESHAVIWTEPRDLAYDPREPNKGLGRTCGNRFLTVFCDGTVRSMSSTASAKLLRALFTRSGGEAIRAFDD